MGWITARIDTVGGAASWLAALGSFSCTILAFVPNSGLSIAIVGAVGGATGLVALWANDVAAKRRDKLAV